MTELSPIELPGSHLGTHISDAIGSALTVATERGVPVCFDFNGVHVVVNPGDNPDDVLRIWSDTMDANAAAYRASPAGIKAAQEAAEWLTRLQALHDELMAKLPGVVTDESALVQWCEDFSRTDHIGIKGRNYPGAIALMEAAGWRCNDMVGNYEAVYRQPEAMARWLIGQAMDCMARDLPPHGIMEKFAAEYRRMRGGV